ncbi:MAG TPA: glycosyltransferase [Oscillatoriales cyanobacterium M59_W2019_021]|nr:glycosyltransferase [Oscillatoriales cyanobacterium M4454_W2019_049]HIK49727.1 glycosyltransferase [Oscillatoriales cyanobacterium M59_W2019_021]
MKILAISATFPYPPSRGGTQVRTFNLLKALSQRHEITLATQRSADVTEDEIEGLRQWVADLWVFARPPAVATGTWEKLKRFGRFAVEGTPPSVVSYQIPQMQAAIDRAIASRTFDALTCEHSANEIFVRPQWRQHLRTVVNIHSSVYGTCRQQVATGTAENPGRDRLYLPLLYRYERRYIQKFSQLVVTTEEDRQQLQEFSPDSRVEVIPNGVDLNLFPPRKIDPGGHHLIFVGAMDNIANIDAVCFLARSIFPAIRQRYPQATLALVGANPVAEVTQLGQLPGVTVTGRVPSMVEYLQQATVCVLSMRIGYGIKNKTLEAMAAGTPVVGSDRALEGLAVESPLRALRANTVEEYVEAISRLLENPQLRSQLSQNGRSFVESEYTWERAGRQYEEAVSIGRSPYSSNQPNS